MTEEPRSSFVPVGGLRMHYLAWGEAGAPALVLLHDLAESADVWAAVAPRLATDFHVIAPDLRGHGDSDWIDSYSSQEQGDDIGEMIEVLGIGPAAIMGTGDGGRAAAMLAARQEHALTRLVLIDTGVVSNLEPEREASNTILSMPRVYDSPEEYIASWCALRHALGLRLSPEPSAWETAHAPRVVRRISTGGWAPRCDLDGYQRYRAWAPGDLPVDYHEEFHEITTPALLVRGAYSPILSPEQAEDTAASIDACGLAEISDARHDILADNPAMLIDAVLPFLRGAGPG
jgi:pimeloyl-ACP methyl ester carboxylesterase